MPNTYTQLYIHFVFAVQNRSSLIDPMWQTDLYKYMNGIIAQHGHKPYIINGTSDHVHILVSMSPVQAPSDLMYHTKRSSSLWINQNRFVTGKFSWQEGFGAFSCSKKQLQEIIKYIEQQEYHHNSKVFYDEYLELLRDYEIDFDERYVFKPVE